MKDTRRHDSVALYHASHVHKNAHKRAYKRAHKASRFLNAGRPACFRLASALFLGHLSAPKSLSPKPLWALALGVVACGGALAGCGHTQIVYPNCNDPRDAEPLHREAPRYPAWASLMKVEGYVDFSFRVEASGRVRDVTVVDAKPREVFEKEARTAIEKWRFEPATCAGKKVPSLYRQRLTFKRPATP